MATTLTPPDVMTLEEVAALLRLSEATVGHYAARLAIPGRQIGDQWRFSRTALEQWLRGPTPKEVLLSQAGAFENDKEELDELRASIYRGRGRPETEEDR
jgi:excisionase family DNA binding protein